MKSLTMEVDKPSNSKFFKAKEEEEMSVLKQNMITRLAKTNAHFKHQARGEPDLTIDEKCSIARDLLSRSAGLFLERFSNFLSLEDIECFSEYNDDYLINFYVNKIKEFHGDKNKNVVKNRRYKALQEMMDGGEYFSETTMQMRDPLLYEQLVGQYETEEEKQEKDIDKTDLKFSSILLKFMDKQEMKSRYERMKDTEEMQEEEEEDTDEDEEENAVGGVKVKEKEDDSEDDFEKPESLVSEAEKLEMKQEFLRIMQERFLSGEESQFDYSKVDSNPSYDSMDLVDRDAEEKYFDQDSDSMG